MSTIDQFLASHKPKSGRALCIGNKVYGDKIDRRTLYADAVGLDMLDGPSVDIVHDLENPLPKEHGQFDHVDICSVLEHVRKPWVLAPNVERLMVSGGTILVAVPFVWRVHGYPSDYWRMTPEAIKVLFPGIDWKEFVFATVGGIVERPPAERVDGVPWFERTEVFGFGRKR